ncbi:hypothetical protein [Rhizobacter sp. LjRoot28]|uniref:DUF7931 domain-containing protein n=1 Tax=Rhizobacter sp. LjRoot28 TaxID=3342309 RepID=UPI003ED00D5F
MTAALPTHRMLHSRSEFHDALREAFAQAATQGCRELFLCDPDFADWPLGEMAVVELLTRWAMSHRKLTVLALHYDEVVRRHPRWVAWRRQWSHVVECRAIDDIDPEALPTMLLAPGVVTVRLFDARNHRASVSTEVADAVRAREDLDAVLQRSVNAFPASTLGL